MAAAAKLRVALYPHQGSWLERVQDGVRVAKKTGRKNVGVVFSEVHFFLCDEEKNLEATLEAARPFLYVVNINGTDSNASKELARVLQPLDRGSFDNLKLLKLLRKKGYAGPIGFHGYMIDGDVARKPHPYQGSLEEALRPVGRRDAEPGTQMTLKRRQHWFVRTGAP